MLPKRTLPSIKRNGRHDKLTPVDSLCNMWVDNNVITLWEMAKNRAQVLQGQHRSNLSNTHNRHKRHIDLAVSYGQAGMLGKACKILTSGGLAPNNETTWNLLLSKHPASQLPSIPEITQEPVSLGSDFNILSVLRSFPKDTGACPSGLRVQHLLDVSSTALPTPICASLRGFCKLVHISRTTPPSLSSEALRAFDGETRSCFSACLAADVTDAAWRQAQLILSFGGLGLRSLALHSSTAFLASFSASARCHNSDAVTIESVLADQPRQRSLSQKLDGHLFETLLMSTSPANKARLLSASAPHASAWLSVAPSVGLNLHLSIEL
ncbi:hypothetical protein EMCRGX_G005137 [Ephydatia muelleri]